LGEAALIDPDYFQKGASFMPAQALAFPAML